MLFTAERGVSASFCGVLRRGVFVAPGVDAFAVVFLDRVFALGFVVVDDVVFFFGIPLFD